MIRQNGNLIRSRINLNQPMYMPITIYIGKLIKDIHLILPENRNEIAPIMPEKGKIDIIKIKQI